MRCASALIRLVIATVAVAGCAAGQSVAAGPAESSAAATSSQEAPSSSTAASSTDAGPTPPPPSDDVLRRVSAALTAAGVEDLGPGTRFLWNPDLSGTWRGGTAFAWIIDPEAVDQVAEVRGSVLLRAKDQQVTAVVHGPELVMVRIPCDDVAVDVAAGVDVEQGTSDEENAVELAQALYPALAC
jgi:hypothetical protein